MKFGRGGARVIVSGKISHILVQWDDDASPKRMRSLCGAVGAWKVGFGEWRSGSGGDVSITSAPTKGTRVCKACARCKNGMAVAARLM